MKTRTTSSGHRVRVRDPASVDGKEATVARLDIEAVIACQASTYLRKVYFLVAHEFTTSEIARILDRTPSSISHARERIRRMTAE